MVVPGVQQPPMGLVVGLDCGGSSTRLVAIDEAGRTRFQGQSGAANLASTPEGRVRRNLEQAAKGCPAPECVCGCFAGLVDVETRKRGEEILHRIFPRARVRAVPDYYAALYSSPSESDVTVIAGTGSLVCSAVGDAVVKSGGRGYLLGDEGSASRYGRRALVAFLEAPHDASEPLRHAVHQTFSTLEEGALVSHLYRSGAPASLLAKLARAAGADAREGILYAAAALEEETSALVRIVLRHLERHRAEKSDWTICLAGGLWKGPAVFRETFERIVRREALRPVTVVRPERPPISGALQLAERMRDEH
jgi:N-acetylglucosamine kinase-like BadF-type ATPase